MVGARATRFSSSTRRNTGVSRMPSRIHSPTATMPMLSRNGIRQPQTRNWSPEIQLKTNTAKLARNSPAGAPNCGQDAIKPRFLLVRAHSIASSTEPPHSPPTPMPWIRRRREDDRAPDPDHIVAWHEADESGGDAGQQQGDDQRRLAA